MAIKELFSLRHSLAIERSSPFLRILLSAFGFSEQNITSVLNVLLKQADQLHNLEKLSAELHNKSSANHINFELSFADSVPDITDNTQGLFEAFEIKDRSIIAALAVAEDSIPSDLLLDSFGNLANSLTEDGLNQDIQAHDLLLQQKTQELAKVGGWEINLEDNTLFWTEQVYNIHEVDPSEKPRLEDGINFYAPEARPIIEAAVVEGIEKGTSWDLELPFITAKNNHIWVRAQGFPLRSNGKTIKLRGTFQDITERKLAEQKVEKSNQRFRLIVQGTGAGIWDWMDVNSTEEWWSPKFYELLGYEFEEIEPNLKTFESLLHPDDREQTFAKVEEHFKHDGPFSAEYRLRSKSGEYRWFLGNGQVQRNESGEPTRMVGSIIDITPRKMAESELRETKEEVEEVRRRLEIATQASRIGIWDWKITSNELIWDETMYDLYGIDQNTFAGAYESWQAGLHPDDKERSDREVQEAVNGEREFNTSFRVIWPDNSIKHLRARATVTRD